MADDTSRPFTLLDPDGKPADVPDTAVAYQHAQGRVKFAPGGQVPAVIGGQKVWIPSDKVDDAKQNYGAELDIGEGNGGVAAAYGILSGIPGATTAAIWAKRHIMNDERGASMMQQEAEAAEAEHPIIHGVASLATGLGLTGGMGAAESVVARSGLSGIEAAQAGRVAASTGEAINAGRTAVEVQAAIGGAAGNPLTSVLKAVNPYNLVGKAGEVAGGLVKNEYGSAALRWGTEGALLSAASGVDEDAVGNHETTAESVLANLETGALFGGTLGLVATGASRLLTSAGRVADRLSEAQIGGTPGELSKARNRFGRGTLGADYAEVMANRGVSPFASKEAQYEAVKAENLDRGKAVATAVKDLDENFSGVNYAEMRADVQAAAAEKAKDITLQGGNGQAIYDKILADADAAAGWKPMPEKAPPFTATHDGEFERLKSEAGLPPVPPEPKIPTKMAERAYWRDTMAAEGLDLKLEKPVENLKSGMGKAYQEYQASLAKRLNDAIASGDMAERQRLSQQLLNGPESFKLELNKGIAERNSRRIELRNAASDELLKQYETAQNERAAIRKAHEGLYAMAGDNVNAAAAQAEKEHALLTEATAKANRELKASYETVWKVRQKVDAVIPYNRASPWADAASNMKLAIRSAMEKHIESAMDTAAAKAGGAKAELADRYVRAKMAYSRSSAMMDMASRGEGKEAAHFGKITKFGAASHSIGVLGAVAMGHPLAAAAYGIGMAGARKYAGPVAASVMHKASRIAELRALTQETQIAMRRGVRASAVGGEFAASRVALPNVPPHEMRATAVDAMRQVLKTSKDPSLAHRLSMLDPSLPVLAPKVNAAFQGKARQAIMLLAAKIPQHVRAALGRGETPDHTALSDSQAREFMEAAAVVHDPRWATDMASQGRLSPNAANMQKLVWPVLSGEHRATIQRMGSGVGFTANRKSQLGMLDSKGPSVPGYAMALQLHAAQVAQGSGPTTTPKGMTHASAGNKGLNAGAAGLATMSEGIESGPPGRRGRKGGLGF